MGLVIYVLASQIQACSSFVSDMSTGYSGNFGYPLSKNWAFDQFHEFQFATPEGPFDLVDLDKVAVSGRDIGAVLMQHGGMPILWNVPSLMGVKCKIPYTTKIVEREIVNYYNLLKLTYSQDFTTTVELDIAKREASSPVGLTTSVTADPKTLCPKSIDIKSFLQLFGISHESVFKVGTGKISFGGSYAH